jgi:hypothetical protein
MDSEPQPVRSVPLMGASVLVFTPLLEDSCVRLLVLTSLNCSNCFHRLQISVWPISGIYLKSIKSVKHADVLKIISITKCKKI